ncbi:MAG: DUF4388 domain-containing protein [Myxococcota bacterium]
MRPEDVDVVLARLREGRSARFGELAVELGMLDDDGLARALAQQFRLNMVPDDRLARLSVAPEVLDLIPRGLIRERMLVPTFLDEEKRVLSLLVADPTDIPSLRAAQTAARAARLRLFVAPRGAMRSLIDRLLPPEEDVADERSGPEPTAPRGITVVFEPDSERANALRRLEHLEGGSAEIVGDPEQVSAFIEANQADRVFFRRSVAHEVEPYLPAWRRLRPLLLACPIDAYGPSRRAAVSYDRARGFHVALLRHLLLAGRPDGGADVQLAADLAHELAEEMGLPGEHRDAVALVALFAELAEGDTEDRRYVRVGELLRRFDPPYDVGSLLDALGQRARGEEGPGRHLGADVVFTARAVARAGAGEDPVAMLGEDAARHDGAVLKAAAAVLRRRGLRRQVAGGAEAGGFAIAAGAGADGGGPAIAGRLADLGLVDLLQTLTLAGKTALVNVVGTAEIGTVQVRDGRIVAAWHGARDGEEAFHSLAASSDGRFEVRFADDGRTNLSGKSEYLMLEAVRRRDERRA